MLETVFLIVLATIGVVFGLISMSDNCGGDW